MQAISAVRVLSYDSVLMALKADIAAEYTGLRNGTLVRPMAVELKADETRMLPIPVGKGLAMDVEVIIEIPQDQSDFIATALTVLAEGEHGVTLNMTVAGLPGERVGSGVVTGGVSPTNSVQFALLEGEDLEIRVLVDRSIVEFFVMKGRAAFTTRAYPTLSQNGLKLWSGSRLKASKLAAWEMGCGWIS